MSTRFVDRIAFETNPPSNGSGDALLMIHGLGGSSNTWAPIMNAVTQFGVIRLDLPGSGRSDRVQGPLSISGFVDAVFKVLKAAGLSRVHVAAHSMGAIVATHMAAREPAAVRSLALFGPLLAPPDSARTPIRARGQKARTEEAAGLQTIADALLSSVISSETRSQRPVATAFVRESMMRQSAEGYARSCDALADAQPADTSGLTCPALLVTGDEDPVAPPQAVRMMAEKLASSGARVETEILRRCGHWPTIEMPEACSALMRRFYAQRFAK